MAEEKKGFFKRLVSGLTKTRDNIVAGFDSLFTGYSTIDDDFYEELEEKLLHLVREINRNWENDKYQAFGREWMKQIAREGQEQEGTVSRDEIVKQVKSYITANLQEELRIEQLAKVFYLSADYLSRLFKKEEGISIGDFIQEERMFLAKELLKEGKLSIARVAYECGYDNYSYFTKIFKKKYGITPREFGQSLKE